MHKRSRWEGRGPVSPPGAWEEWSGNQIEGRSFPSDDHSAIHTSVHLGSHSSDILVLVVLYRTLSWIESAAWFRVSLVPSCRSTSPGPARRIPERVPADGERRQTTSFNDSFKSPRMETQLSACLAVSFFPLPST